MKETEIRDILLKNKICIAQHGSLCATIIAGVGAYNNGLGEIMHTMKDHVLHFNHDGIYILAIDDMNGLLQEDTLSFIPHEQISSTSIRAKIFTFIVTVQTDKGEIQYKVRKNVLASPWHKENLSYFLLTSSL